MVEHVVRLTNIQRVYTNGMLRFQKCESCEKPMEGFIYEYSSECDTSLDTYDEQKFPNELRCEECGIYDWKHTHNTRRDVVFCKNEECKDPEYHYSISVWGHPLDYSRIPLWDRGMNGPRDAAIYEIIFGTSDYKKLKQLGRKMTIKEIEKKMKHLRQIQSITAEMGISRKLHYTDVCDMAERDYYNKFGIKACLSYESKV